MNKQVSGSCRHDVDGRASHPRPGAMRRHCTCSPKTNNNNRSIAQPTTHQIIIVFALFAMVACVLANEYGGGYGYQTEEKKFISLPALKLKLGTDKLTFKLPNLMTLFQSHQEHHYPQHY
jgi:hypothetical protein